MKTALPGTRSLQAVKSMHPREVGVRLLSCFCRGCQGDEPCNNTNGTLMYICPDPLNVLVFQFYLFMLSYTSDDDVSEVGNDS